MNLQALLIRAGLDQNEVDTYLALIALGEATAGQIAQKSGVPRTYTYRILDNLIEKDLVQALEGDSVRRFRMTDYDAPKRYVERQQLKLYQVQQEAQSLSSQLENLANPQVPAAVTELLRDQPGREDFWQLMHSTLTREIWVINPPKWWGDPSFHKQVRKWEQYRAKQHIWEKRFIQSAEGLNQQDYTEHLLLPGERPQEASLFLIDQYQVQVTNWDPFRAVRIESQEMVAVLKAAFPVTEGA